MNFNRNAQQELKTALTRRPFVYIDHGGRLQGAFMAISGLLWTGIPVFFILRAFFNGQLKVTVSGLIFVTVFGGIGAGIFVLGLYLITRTIKTVITDDTVAQESKWLFGHNFWKEPSSAFPGILQRSEYHSGGRHGSSYTLYIVELHHQYRKKRVRLYESRSPDGIRSILEDCCRTLGMPAIEQDGDTLITRSVEDLDKSVRDLAHEGKLDVQFNPSSPPPPGLELSTRQGFLRIKIKSKGIQGIGLLIGVLFASLFIYIGFFNDAPVVFGFAGCVFMAAIIAAAVWESITRAAIDISPGKLRVFRLTPWGEISEQVLPAQDIESVRVGKKHDGQLKAVQIITDERNLTLGAGLSNEAQEWLKNCILTIITRSVTT